MIFMLVHAGIACICPWLPLGFNDVTSAHADSILYSLGAMIAGFSNQRTRVQRQPQSATGSENDADDADQHDADSPEPAAKRSKAAQYHVFYNHKGQLIDHARRLEKAHPGMTFLIFVASPHEGHKMHIAAGGAAFLEQENFQQISTKLRHHFKRGKELLADMIRQGQHVTAPKGSANINNWYITFLGQCRHFIADLHFAEFQSRESRAVYRTAGSIWQALGTDQVLWGPGGGEGASDADRMYEDMHAPDTVGLAVHSVVHKHLHSACLQSSKH